MLAAPSSCVTFNPPQPGRNKFGSAKITPVRDLPNSKYYQYCGAGPILAAPPAVTNLKHRDDNRDVTTIGKCKYS